LLTAGPGQAAGLFTFTPADFLYGPYTGGHSYSYNVAYGYGLPFSAADTFRPVPYANAGMFIPWPGNPDIPPPLFARKPYHAYVVTPPLEEVAPQALPADVLGPQVAVVQVRVPPGAELWFDGEKTAQTGADRVFTTPALESGKEFHYIVRARWNDNGQSTEQFRTITVRPGQRVQVLFPVR
jgi:uncharacterized protein (TIGR03000 family)